MVQKISAKDARLNLIVPLDLKRKLIKTAVSQGKKVSALVRESIEEKLARVERKHFEEKMREAARKFEFEKAAQLRDRIKALKEP